MDLVIVGIALVAVVVFVYAMISNKPTVKEVNEQINLDVVKEEVKPATPKVKKPAAKKAPAAKASTKKPAAKKTSKPVVKSVAKTPVTRKK